MGDLGKNVNPNLVDGIGDQNLCHVGQMVGPWGA